MRNLIMCEHCHHTEHDEHETILHKIKNGEIFDEKFLMGIAIVGAVCIGEYLEALMVFILYNIGEFLQDKAVEKSKKSITELMDLRPDTVNVLVGDKVIKQSPQNVNINDIIIAKTGEKTALDGVVVEGTAFIDTSALTGEAFPREVKVGDEILSGCIISNGFVKIRAEKTFAQSTVSEILELVEHAKNKKAKAENFITKFARIYTPFVVGLALIIGVLTPLILQADFFEWLKRALTLLVISCPCALVISVPLGFFAGIGGASRNGVLVKGSKYIEALAKAKAVAFDKTGTLTKGHFSIEKVVSTGNLPEEEILKLIVSIEKFSNHPIAKSILNSYSGDFFEDVTDISEISGKGLRGKINGDEVCAGNKEFVNAPDCGEIGNIIYLSKNGTLEGYVVLSDVLKPESVKTIFELKKQSIRTYMLSGDNDEIVQKIASILKLDKAYSKLLPQEKLYKFEEIIKAIPQTQTALYVGDGINDAPVLKRADVGIAMGGIGSDCAVESADVIIMNDNPYKVFEAIKISQKTMRIVKQNIIFAISVKAVFLALGTFGMMTMWGAIFADVGVTLLAILNSLRAMHSPLCK